MDSRPVAALLEELKLNFLTKFFEKHLKNFRKYPDSQCL